MNITGRGDEITVKQETLFTGEQGEQGNTLYSRGWTHRGRGMRRGFARGYNPRGWSCREADPKLERGKGFTEADLNRGSDETGQYLGQAEMAPGVGNL